MIKPDSIQKMKDFDLRGFIADTQALTNEQLVAAMDNELAALTEAREFYSRIYSTLEADHRKEDDAATGSFKTGVEVMLDALADFEISSVKLKVLNLEAETRIAIRDVVNS